MTRSTLRSRAARLRLAIEIFVVRQGLVGVLAIAMLFAASSIGVAIVLPMQREHRALTSAIAERQQRLARHTDDSPAPVAARISALDTLDATLPTIDRANESVQALFTLAAKHGLALAQSDYQTTRDANSGTTRVQATLPLHGAYPAVRAYAEDVLRRLPHASIDAIHFKRASIGDPRIEARMRVTLWFKTNASLVDASIGAVREGRR